MPENLKVEGKMNIHITSPTQIVFDGVADKVLLPAVEGDMMILKDRAPLFVATRPGALWIYNKGERPECYFVSDGIAEIRRNICSILAWAVKADAIDKDKIHLRLEEALREMEHLRTDIERKQVQLRIDFFNGLLDKPSLLIPPDFKD